MKLPIIALALFIVAVSDKHAVALTYDRENLDLNTYSEDDEQDFGDLALSLATRTNDEKVR